LQRNSELVQVTDLHRPIGGDQQQHLPTQTPSLRLPRTGEFRLKRFTPYFIRRAYVRGAAVPPAKSADFTQSRKSAHARSAGGTIQGCTQFCCGHVCRRTHRCRGPAKVQFR
jgi:hypothetical protein